MTTYTVQFERKGATTDCLPYLKKWASTQKAFTEFTFNELTMGCRLKAEFTIKYLRGICSAVTKEWGDTTCGRDKIWVHSVSEEDYCALRTGSPKDSAGKLNLSNIPRIVSEGIEYIHSSTFCEVVAKHIGKSKTLKGPAIAANAFRALKYRNVDLPAIVIINNKNYVTADDATKLLRGLVLNEKKLLELIPNIEGLASVQSLLKTLQEEESCRIRRVPQQVSREDEIVSDLSKLVGRPITQLRKEGKLMSLIDVIMIITGQNTNVAGGTLRDINNTYLAVQGGSLNCSELKIPSPKIRYYQFPGQGQRETPVAEIDVVIEIIFLLPGAAAAKVRQQAAPLFVRYIGGDESIIEKVLKNKEHAQPEVIPQEDQIVSDLSKLVGRPVTQLRKEGKLMSLIDVIMIVTGQDANVAARTLRDMCHTHLAVKCTTFNCSELKIPSPKIRYYQFPGERQRETPVAEIDVVIEIIFLLPGAAAAKVRQHAAQLFVRYIGGDESIIEEVLKNKEVQHNLAASSNNEPVTTGDELARVCVSACGAAVQGAYKIDFKIPDEIWDEGDLYFARLQGNDILMKLARSTQINVRSEQHARNGVSIIAHAPNCLKLEIPLQRLLNGIKATVDDGAPPKQREWFKWPGTPEQLLEEVGAEAIAAAMTKQSFSVNGNKRQRLSDDRVLEAEVATRIAEEHAKVLEIQAKTAEGKARSDAVIAEEKAKSMELQAKSAELQAKSETLIAEEKAKIMELQAKSEAVIAEEKAKSMELQAKSAELHAKSEVVVAEERVKAELLNTISSGDLIKAEKHIALLKQFRGL
jgi:hypothetical protein